MRIHHNASFRLCMVCAALLLLVGCEEESQTSSGSGGSGTQVTASAPGKTGDQYPRVQYANWPPSVSDADSFTFAANQLAINYEVVLDGSGSMDEHSCSGSDTKSDVSKRSLKHFAGLVPSDANLGLLAFDSRGITERVPLGASNRDEFVAAVEDTRADSGTPLRTAITEGYRILTEQAQRQSGYGEYHLVIVTDGRPDMGENPTRIVDQILSESPVIIYTIGFCIGDDHPLNQPGQTIYREANNPEELTAGLEAVLAESPNFIATDFEDISK